MSRVAFDQFTARQRQLIRFAKNELLAFDEKMRGKMAPHVYEKVFKAKYMELVDKYGAATSELAIQLFYQIRPDSLPAFEAILARMYSQEELGARLAEVIGDISISDSKYAQGASHAIQRDLLDLARRTMRDNCRRDRKSGVRFARIPSGAKTCAWCYMLASNGFVYTSAESAGKLNPDHFHPDCDCMIVPSWEKSPRVDGYHPDEMQEVYRQAQKAAGSTKRSAVTAKLREQNPGVFTDSLIPEDQKKKRGPKPKEKPEKN